MIRFAWPVRFVLVAIAAFVLILLYGPLFVAILFSFIRMRRGQIQWDSFSFDAYAALARNQGIIEALGNTLIVGVAAVAASLVLGTIFAFYYHASRGRAREILQLVVFLPFLMPPILIGLSLLIYFRQIDLDRSLFTVVIGHTVFVLALVYRTVLSRLQALSASLVEASLDLGASRWQTFRYVLLPNLSTAVLAAAILAFALSFDETLITLLVTDTESTLPIRLWAMKRLGFTPDINALVTLILVATTALCLLAVRYLTVPEGR
jgi:ABC-type spermidine/putrescine transport system permease subunit II